MLRSHRSSVGTVSAAWHRLPPSPWPLRTLEKTASTRAEQAVARDASAPSATKGESGKASEGSINMSPKLIQTQGIEVAPVGKGVLARVLNVPGTVTLDPGRVARVPGRVVGTVTEMRKRLGDPVAQGEV